MRIKHFNFVGEFRGKSNTGTPNCYYEGDVVYHEGKAFIASKKVEGISPTLGEKAGWISLSDREVLYESENQPFYAKVGDSWFNTSTGVMYTRIKNDFAEIWIEL